MLYIINSPTVRVAAHTFLSVSPSYESQERNYRVRDYKALYASGNTGPRYFAGKFTPRALQLPPWGRESAAGMGTAPSGIRLHPPRRPGGRPGSRFSEFLARSPQGKRPGVDDVSGHGSGRGAGNPSLSLSEENRGQDPGPRSPSHPSELPGRPESVGGAGFQRERRGPFKAQPGTWPFKPVRFP